MLLESVLHSRMWHVCADSSMLHAYSTGAPVPRRAASPFIIRRQSCRGFPLDSILIMEDSERGFLHSEDGAVARRTLSLPSPLFLKYWVGGEIGNMHGGDERPLVLCPVFGFNVFVLISSINKIVRI